MTRIVVLDQAGGMADQVRRAMTSRACAVARVTDVEEAARALEDATSLLVLNPCTQPTTEFAPLERLVLAANDLPFLVLTGCAPVEAAARILFPSASAVLRLPLAPIRLRDEILSALGNGGRKGRGNTETRLRGLKEMVGRAPAMQEVYQRLQRAALSDATVLIAGETGVGKELAARTIHELSPRKTGPFIVVSCAELPESLIESELFGHARGSFTGAHRARAGLFEAAQGGTLLLDEISDASPAVQMRLLRVVEERQVRRVGEVRPRGVDVRVIAATQERLEEKVDAGRFREDLFYRLRVLSITLPPLRERREDIPALVARCLRELARPHEVPRHCSPLALDALQSYDWPGNVRELFAVVESAATARPGDTISAADLPPEVTASWSADGESEADRILKALEESGGHKGAAAGILGMSRTTLWRKMTHLGISTTSDR